jgi:hypothetical protein
MPGYSINVVKAELAYGLGTTTNVATPGVSVTSKNTSQKAFIRNDTITEIVNHSKSDSGNVSEIS